MIPRSTTIRSALAIGAVATVVVVGAPLAFSAAASADTEKRGSCSSGARYDYEVEKDDGRFEVNFEVDSNRTNEQWRIQLWQDGKRYYSAVRTTDHEGEADAEQNRPNTRGKDHFKARAVSLSSGEVCTVKIVRR
jgi:hypothetical protein